MLWEGAGGGSQRNVVVWCVPWKWNVSETQRRRKEKKEGDQRETPRETMPTLHMYILMSYSRTSLTASIMISLIFM